jgi:outer membrane receptor protein involved in Fe transport
MRRIGWNAPSLRAMLLALLVLACWTTAEDAAAQGVGSITGVIRNAETGEKLDYANVVLTRVADQAQWGAMSLGGGRFFLQGIPAGDYVLKVLYLGYKPVERPVTVVSGESLDVVFDLEITVVKTFEVFEITGSSIMVEVKDTEFVQTIGSENLTDYAVDTVEEAVARQAGVVSRGGELHVRGGRSGEISFRIDGVAVDDPLGGNALSVGTFSVANVQTVTGGQDPEYGNALSGVVDITTKEGNPEKFELQMRFMTDDFGRQDRTFTNYDRFEVGLGGPTPIPRFTYFLSGDFRFSDQENYNRAYRPETKVDVFGVDVFKYRRRQFNDAKGSLKLAYAFDPRNQKKLTAEFTGSYTRWETFLPNWDVQGYVQTTVRMPRLEQGPSGLEFGGRYDTFFYGPWVDRLQELATTRPVRYAQTNSSQTQPMPVMQLRNARGEPVWVIAQPVFIGARYDSGLYQTEVDESDSSFVAFNSANRGPQNDRFSNQGKIVWRQTLTEDTFYTLKVARVAFDTNQTVDPSKYPYQYLHGGIDSPAPFGGQTRQYSVNSDYYTDADQPIFVTDGSDWPLFDDQFTVQYSGQLDITSNRYEGHKLKSGLRVVYNDLQREFLASPAIEVTDRFTGEIQQGAARNIFHTYNPEASFYLQDRWEYEGMVISGGFRWDMFSPGSAAQIDIENEELDRNVEKYKHELSPRLGFAFPITDRDGFHFHYGRFVQFPGRDVLFASQSTIGNTGTLGNPNLDAETTIQYQAGIKHQFNDFLAAQFAVYNKDIYGLISATQVTDEATGNTLARYINRAYGNARGVELTLERRFHNRWSFELAYTYAFADGVASSQEFGANPNGLEFLPNQELPLNWDQRHSLAMDLRIAEPQAWAASISFDYGSGFPWTPFYRFERRQDPLLENSERLPATYDLRLQAERHVNFYGQHLILYLQGLNLLDQDQVEIIQPGIFPGTIEAQNAGLPYLTETGKFGGAYLQDIDGDTRDDFVPINDPRVFAQHRLFRIGIGWMF